MSDGRWNYKKGLLLACNFKEKKNIFLPTLPLLSPAHPFLKAPPSKWKKIYHLHQNHFYPQVKVYSNSHQVLLYLQRLCSLLQIKASVVTVTVRELRGGGALVVLARQSATVKEKRHLYIFLVQLLKCKTFPKIPWEASFPFFPVLFFLYIIMNSHLT